MKIAYASTLALLSVVTLGACNETRETIELQGGYQTQIKEEFSIRVGGVGCVDRDLAITANQFTVTETAFDDIDCEGKALGRIVTETALDVGDLIPNTANLRVLNLKIQKITVTPLTQEWSETLGFDLTGDCRISDVPVNTTVDVTGKDCKLMGHFAAKDQIFFSSYRLTDNLLETTQLPQESLENVGTEEAPAPRNLDVTVRYYRK